jgi:hypothetical protein
MKGLPAAWCASALLILLLAACTSGAAGIRGEGTAGPAVAAGAGRPSAPATMVPEVIRGFAADPDASSMPVKASGAFTATGTLELPFGDPRTIVFRFSRGTLVVLNATGPTSDPLRLDQATCAFSQSADGTYRILSGNSSGRYAGTTGHGWHTLDTSGTAAMSPGGGGQAGGRPAGSLTILFHGALVLADRAAP